MSVCFSNIALHKCWTRLKVANSSANFFHSLQLLKLYGIDVPLKIATPGAKETQTILALKTISN